MWSDAMGQGEKAYPFVCPECGEEVRGNKRHFSIQPLLNRIMLTIEGNRTMTNVLTAFSCQRTFVIFYLLNSDITRGVVHNYAFSCIH